MKDVLALLSKSVGDRLSAAARYALGLASAYDARLSVLIAEIESIHRAPEPDIMQAGSANVEPPSSSERLELTAKFVLSAAKAAGVSCETVAPDGEFPSLRERVIHSAQLRDVLIVELVWAAAASAQRPGRWRTVRERPAARTRAAGGWRICRGEDCHCMGCHTRGGPGSARCPSAPRAGARCDSRVGSRRQDYFYSRYWRRVVPSSSAMEHCLETLGHQSRGTRRRYGVSDVCTKGRREFAGNGWVRTRVRAGTHARQRHTRCLSRQS